MELRSEMRLRRLDFLRKKCAIQFEVVKLIFYVPVGHHFLADEHSICLRLVSGFGAMRRRYSPLACHLRHVAVEVGEGALALMVESFALYRILAIGRVITFLKIDNPISDWLFFCVGL